MIDINKFDDLGDLPISEEILGAYLEGDLQGAEFREVQNYIQDNSYMSSLIDGVESDMNIINDLELSYQENFENAIETDDIFAGVSLPEIALPEIDTLIDPSSPLTDGIILGEDFICPDGEDDFFHPDNQQDNSHYNSHDIEFGITDNAE